jgi:hypothetical protein
MQSHSRTKYITIDTRTSTNEFFPLSEYCLYLPDEICDIQSMTVSCVEVPITFYNISTYMYNNFFRIINDTNAVYETIMVVLPNDNYTISNICQALQNAISCSCIGDNLMVSLSPTNTIEFKSKSGRYTLQFDTDITGNVDNKCWKSKLGWILGFRFPNYTIEPNSIVTAETICDFTRPRYLYLSIENCHNEHKKHSFDSSLFFDHVDKHIISRITLENRGFPYGSLLPANVYNGLLVSDTRNYREPIKLKKLKIKLLNEYGYVLNLNGFDLSFLLILEQEEEQPQSKA